MNLSTRDRLATKEYFDGLIESRDQKISEYKLAIDDEIRERGEGATAPAANLVESQLIVAEAAYSRGASVTQFSRESIVLLPI